MSIHETLVPTDDAEVQIEATADTLKPVFAYADKLVDELKLRVDEDGLSYEVVDPANVTMCSMDVPAEAFDTFEADETTIGVSLGRTMSALRAGRKRQNDAISVYYENSYMTTEVHREYDGVEMDLRNRIAMIDPDSIRQEPDIPELELTEQGTVPRLALEGGVNAANTVSNYVTFESDGSDLLLSGQGDTDDTAAVISGVMDGEGARALFSNDYTTDMLKALKTVGVDDVTLHLGDEFPFKIKWETEWNDATVTGQWCQAPRIQSD